MENVTQNIIRNQPDVRVGQSAPDFTLQDENGQEVTLGALRGEPVVLIFYPFDWSGGCTKEMCSMRDATPDWRNTGARVFGISRDSIYSHKAWREHLDLGYSLLADLRGDVAKKYGAWNEENYRADRMTVVIDQEGIVRYAVHNPASTIRDHSGALQALRDISQVASS